MLRVMKRQMIKQAPSTKLFHRTNIRNLSWRAVGGLGVWLGMGPISPRGGKKFALGAPRFLGSCAREGAIYPRGCATLWWGGALASLPSGALATREGGFRKPRIECAACIVRQVSAPKKVGPFSADLVSAEDKTMSPPSISSLTFSRTMNGTINYFRT